MPINGLLKKASKTKNRVNGIAMPKKPQDSVNTATTIETSYTSARDHDSSSHRSLSLAACSLENPAENETMQISYNSLRSPDELPSYPVADTIALIIILINFPNILIMATHLLFSYKEHISAKASGSIITTPPLLMVLFMDAFVVLFTAIVLPSLRSVITDTSHVIIAVSLSGARRRLIFPFATGLGALRLVLARLDADLHLDDIKDQKGGSLWTAGFQRLATLLARIFHLRHNQDVSLSSDYSSASLKYVKSAVAIHIVSLGLIRMFNYWLRIDSTPLRKENEPSHNTAGNNKMKKKTLIPDYKFDLRFSIWDHFLRWRADTSSKCYELTDTSESNKEPNVYIGEIAPRYIVFIVRTSTSDRPSFVLRVNGLPWEAKIISPDEQTDKNSSDAPAIGSTGQMLWTIHVDNLSPKTEYDFSIVFKNHPLDLGEHRFAICTSAKVTTLERRRCDPYLLPAINTNSSEEPTVCVDGLIYPSGPLSPVTTLEETIANASTRLEEKRSLLKRTRKENTKKLQALQRDVDHLVPRISGGIDKNEQRIQGRMLSLQTEIKRIQDSIDEMETEKQHLITVKEEQHSVWLVEKAKRDVEATILDTIRQKYDSEKAKHERRYAIVEAEAQRIRAKADKLSLRRTKIQQDLDRISNEQDQVLNREFQARVSDREFLNKERLQLEAQYLKSILDMSQRTELLELYGNN